MIPLILFIVLAVVVLVLTEVHERQKKAKGQEQPAKRASSSASDGECCGMHLVCEKETLLQPDATPEYYDDEDEGEGESNTPRRNPGRRSRPTTKRKRCNFDGEENRSSPPSAQF